MIIDKMHAIIIDTEKKIFLLNLLAQKYELVNSSYSQIHQYGYNLNPKFRALDLVFYEIKEEKESTLTKYLVKIPSLNPFEKSAI